MTLPPTGFLLLAALAAAPQLPAANHPTAGVFQADRPHLVADLGQGEPWIVWRAYATPWGEPSVLDVDGDGVPEVVFVTSEGILFCLDASNGVEEWRIRLPGGPLPLGQPSLHDLDGNGIPDIVVSRGGCLLAVNGSGEILWRIEGVRLSSGDVVVGDLNGDGRPEVAAATSEGILFLDGRTGKRLGLAHSIVAGSQVSLSSGDLDGDGKVEVIGLSGDGTLLVVDGGSMSEELRLRLTPGRSPRGPPPRPLVVDVDGDGVPEVVAAVGDEVSGLEVPSGSSWFVRTWGRVLPHLSAADVDGDGSVEVFVQTEIGAWGGCVGELVCIDASTGDVEWRKRTPCSYWGALILDADSDGDLELLFHTSYPEGGALQVLDALTGEEERTIWFGGTLGFVTPADVDGDGRSELLVGSTSSAGTWLVAGIACVETRPPSSDYWEVRLLPSDYVVARDGIGRFSIEARPSQPVDGPLRLLVSEAAGGEARTILEAGGGAAGASAELELPLGVHRLLVEVLGPSGRVLHRETLLAVVGDAELSVEASPGVLGALLNFSLDLKPLPSSPNPVPAPKGVEHPRAPEAAMVEFNVSAVGGEGWRGPRRAHLTGGHADGSLTVWGLRPGPQRVGVVIESRLGRWTWNGSLNVSGLAASLDLPRVTLGEVSLRLTLTPTGEVEGRWAGTAVVRVDGRVVSWFPVSLDERGLRTERSVGTGVRDVGRLDVKVDILMEGSGWPAVSVSGTTVFLGPWSFALALALSTSALALVVSRVRSRGLHLPDGRLEGGAVRGE